VRFSKVIQLKYVISIVWNLEIDVIDIGSNKLYYLGDITLHDQVMTLLKNHGRAKIGEMKPKSSISYAYVRFPRGCEHLIGQEVEIFEGIFSGKRAVKLELKGKTDNYQKRESPNLMRDINQRLSSIEADIKEIKKAVKVK